MRLFWHRRDLRLRDNRGLAAAAAEGAVVPVFVRDPDLLDRVGDRQRAFFLRGVRRLREAYRDRGGDLLVREGAPSEVLPELAEELGADAVGYNEHYRPERRERRDRVEAACADAGVETASETDLVLVDPARLDAVEAALTTAVTDASVDPFEMLVGGFGVFPSLDYISVVWAGVREGGPELARLHGAVERESTAIGFDPADHEFTPHVTLARMDDARGKSAVQRVVREVDPTVGRMGVSEVRLTESTLTDDGPEYRTLSRFPL